MVMTSTFDLSSQEVCERAQCTYRQLDYWCRIGLIDPIEDGPGRSGWCRRFAVREAECVQALSYFSSMGIMPRSKISHRVLTYVRLFGLDGMVRTGPFAIDLACIGG